MQSVLCSIHQYTYYQNIIFVLSRIDTLPEFHINQLLRKNSVDYYSNSVDY